MMFWPTAAIQCCCEEDQDPPVTCPGPCQTKWPKVLYITDANGTHQIDWNGGTGWTGCYTFNANSSNLTCQISNGPVMVRYGVGCPTFNPCDRVGIFMDYEIKDCNFALGAYYLSNYKICGQSVNRNWAAQSNPGTYTMSPVHAEFSFPTTRLEFGTTHSPLPVSGNIILHE